MFRYSAQRIQTAQALLLPREVLPTGIAALDGVLPDGGFPRGRLSELSGGRSCGKRALAAAICARTLAAGQAAIWIDSTSEFYPLPALEHGVLLDQLLVVRLPPIRARPALPAGRNQSRNSLRHAKNSDSSSSEEPRPSRDGARRGQRRASGCPPALKAAEILLQAGATAALVVVDLPSGMRVPQQHLLARLRLGAETSGAAVLFLTEEQGPRPSGSLGTFICLRLCVARVDASRATVAIAKSKLGKMAHHAVVSLDEPHGLHLDTTV